MSEAVIVDAIRTPIGRAFKGSMATLRPDETLAFVIDQLLERNPGVDPSSVEEVVAGCGLPQGLQANNIARIAVLLSDKLGQETNGSTINRYCASGLDAIRIAANNVVAGQGDVYIAGGVEFVSRYNAAQEAAHPEDQNENLQGKDGQPNAYIAMGLTAENVADKYGVTREQQDEYALKSQQRAVAAQESGVFDREIVPVTLADGTVVSKDDGPRPGTTLEKLAGLQPAFREDGTVTAGNACPLNDGAAAVIVMSDTKAKQLGLTPLARIVSTAVTGLSPEIMGLGPVEASKKALARAGKTIDDIDLVEINEAFAAQVIPSARELGIDPFGDKLNVNGGAIAVGHPFGMTGARITGTLINGLQYHDKTFGLETMCVGGGQGMAMVIERLS
jgi:acetyl-CoA C-acetyltransferase